MSDKVKGGNRCVNGSHHVYSMHLWKYLPHKVGKCSVVAQPWLNFLRLEFGIFQVPMDGQSVTRVTTKDSNEASPRLELHHAT